jgi:hypothetical protein
MIWFKKKQRSSEKIKVKSITFICEQDGVPEQKLKSAFVNLFQNSKSIISAYLVRVDYGDLKDINVALCIRSEKFEDFKLQEKAAQCGGPQKLDNVLSSESLT